MKYLIYVYLFSLTQCFSFIIPSSTITNIKSTKRITYSRTILDSSLFDTSLLDSSLFANFKTALLTNGVGYYGLLNSNQTSLSDNGLLHSAILGISLMTFLDINGYIYCVSYFILGSLVTKIKFNQKQNEGIAEFNNGMREPKNVWGSAAVAMICAISSYIYSDYSEIFKIGYVASLSAKLADTFQSEIGKAYGNTTFLITNLTKVSRGTEGAISLEGTLAGIFGSIILILEGYTLNLIDNYSAILICFISSQFATFCESYIGATFQDKYLNNELVNFINTFIAAMISMLILILLKTPPVI